MAIQPSARYSEAADEVVGFETGYGSQEKGEGMDNLILVFMLRGIFLPWKQPIGYHLVSHGLPPHILGQLIIEALHVTHLAGVRVSILLH